MNNQAFSKIWIIVVIIIIVTGGVLTWQFWWVPKEEVKNETVDWKTYRNEEYGFEIKYPEELETRWHVINEETMDGCVIGEQIRLYFYKKGEAPPNLLDYGIGSDLFEGYLTSSDYRELGVSTKDGSFCGPVFLAKEIILDPPFQLFSTSLTVPRPTQSISCGIDQTAKFSIGRYYNEKYNTLELHLHLGDFALLTNDWREVWKTECPKIFMENIQGLESDIKQFDLVAKSLKFLENYK